MSTKDLQPHDVEEGVETKSDAGSSTTAPSVESGGQEASSPAPTKNGSPRRRKLMMGGGVALLILVAVIVTTVLVTNCNKNKDTTTSSMTAEDSTTPIISVEGEDEAPPPATVLEDAHKPVVSKFEPPFGDISLPTFQEDILQTYQTRQALEEDLTVAVKQMINKVILENLAFYTHYQHHHDDHEAVEQQIAVAAGVGASAASAAGKQASQAKIMGSLTNNQERTVDEGDVLKNDDTYVYAAYGDYLVVWDQAGNMVAQEKMPVPPEAATPQAEEGMSSTFFGGHSTTYAYIESIQLTSQHIMVIVGGLGEYTSQDIAFGNTGTHLRVYNKPTTSTSGSSLELVGTRDIQGYYYNSKYLEETDSVHIVTGGDFSTFSALVEPLDVYHFDGLDSQAYYYAAKLMAEKELIPEFVRKLTDFFITGNDGELPSILKVNNWLTQAQQEKKLAREQAQEVHAEEHFYGSYDQAFRAYMLVTSFAAKDLPTTTAAPNDDGELVSSTTAIIGPSTYGIMYAQGDSIVLNMERYDWDPDTNHSEETLFLVHLKVDASTAQAKPFGVTNLAGYLPNSSGRSIDIEGNDLRIATTLQKWMPLENVWPICGDSWYFDDTCMSEQNWNECFDVALNCRNVIKTGCPYVFECGDGDAAETPEDQSSTENYVSVFDISKGGQMTKHGSVRIGEPHEIIMGVHFGETFSYANTFDQRDPFYVLNLPAGQAPTIAGEIKLEGFSTYLQPLNDDGSIILGIGQNVTGEGMDQAPNGLLVSVFDVSDPAQPKVLASDMLVNPNEHDSYSDAEFEAKAVQYNDGILVIPVSFHQKYDEGDQDDMIWDGDDSNMNAVIPPETPVLDESNNFEGYIVLDVSDVASQGIKEVTRINHDVRKQQQGGGNAMEEDCYYCSGYIAYRRSFLFDDKSLMTVHDSAVISTDLTTGNRLWSFNVTMDGEERNCCY